MQFLKKQDKQLKEVLEATDTSVWEWNALTGELLECENLSAVFGTDVGTPATCEALLAWVYSEDQQSLALVMAGGDTLGDRWEVQFRSLWGDGTTHWISCRGKLFRDENRMPLRGVALCTDITKSKLTEAACQEERDLLAAILDTAGALVVVLDRQGRIVRFNRACLAAIGYPARWLQGQFFWEVFLTPEEATNWLERWHLCGWDRQVHLPCPNSGENACDFACVNGKFPKHHENDCITRYGVRRRIAWTNTALCEEGGELKYLIATGIDITHRVEAEQAQQRTIASLQESEQRFRATFEQAAVGIAHSAIDGRFKRINQRFCEIVGYSAEEMLNLTFADITYQPDVHTDLEQMQSLLEGRISTYAKEKRYRRKDGSLVWVNLTVCLVREEEKLPEKYPDNTTDVITANPKYFIAVIEDISERKRAEAEVEQAKNDLEMRVKERTQKLWKVIRQLREEISYREMAEVALRESEERFRATFEQAAVGIAHLSLDGKFLRVNQRFGEILNYPLPDLLLRKMQEITHPEDLDADLEYRNQLMKGRISNYSIEKRYLQPDAACVWANLTVSLVCDAEGLPKYAIGVIEDISERKQAEAALKQSEAQTRSLASFLAEAQKVAQVGCWEYDVTTSEITWSEELFRIVGLEPRKKSPNFRDYLRRVHRDDVRLVQKAVLQVVKKGNSYEFDQRLVRPDGKIRYIAAKGQPIFDTNGKVVKFFGTIVDITERKLVEHNLRKSEAEKTRLIASLQAQAAQLEKTLKALQETQSQLIQTEKMSSLGQMVAGVAHEINNPVNFIYGNVSYAVEYVEDLLELMQLYQQYYPKPVPAIQAKAEEIDLDYLIQDLPKLVNSMQVGAERIRQIVLSLRNFSRLDEAEKKRVDIHEGIESTLLILQHRLKDKPGRPGIKITKEFGNLPPVECYPAQLNQVFLNILNNAIDALETNPEPQRISIRTELATGQLVDNGQEVSDITLSPLANQHYYFAIVRISDNGSGIPPQILEKIFDPFFTTKAVGKGTGLGLSICYQIIEKHGGKIFVTSQAGIGTEFAICLPIHENYLRSTPTN